MTEARISALLAEVIAQAREAGVPVSHKIAPLVRLNSRARTRFGCCVRQGGGYTIELSRRLLEADEGAVRKVLAHEVLHTCPGCANHGPRWREYAGRMDRAYGYHITRTDSFEELGLADDRPVRYLVICESCGMQIPRMRRSALVDRPQRYRCKCGGRLRVEEGSSGG